MSSNIIITNNNSINDDFNSRNFITINVGGRKFYTTRTTLRSTGDNFFSALLSGHFSSDTDQEGNLFIDRDGEKFQIILEFLRSGQLSLPPHYTSLQLQELHTEAEFYLIAPLITAIETQLSPPSPPPTYLRWDGYYVSSLWAFYFYPPRDNSGSRDILFCGGEGREDNIRLFYVCNKLPKQWKDNAFITKKFAEYYQGQMNRGRITLLASPWTEKRNQPAGDIGGGGGDGAEVNNNVNNVNGGGEEEKRWPLPVAIPMIDPRCNMEGLEYYSLQLTNNKIHPALRLKDDLYIPPLTSSTWDKWDRYSFTPF